MIRCVILLSFLATSLSAQTLEKLAGTYPVLKVVEKEKVTYPAGTLSIISDVNQVGIKLDPAALSSNAVIAHHILTPTAQTLMNVQDNVIRQKHQTLNRTVDLLFSVEADFFVVEITDCSGLEACVSKRVTASRGGAPGVAVDPKQFFTSREGEYTITEAGGVVPKPENATAFVSADPAGVFFVFPYCPSPTEPCDPGMLEIDYAKLTVVEDGKNANGLTVYNLFHTKADGSTGFYRWLEGNGEYIRENHQYQYQNNTIQLVHKMSR